MKKIIYLTYAEAPSGVYSSQVADVISFLNRELDAGIQLLAFISIHDYKKQKAAIRKLLPEAIVLPMLPRATYWRLNTIMLWMQCILRKPTAIIARNVIAANMALKVRNRCSVKKVCFDGRGAIAAEWKEYDVSVVESWKKEIDTLEKKAILESDLKIAVSQKLVEYWRSVYEYSGHHHVVIPCTLNSNFKLSAPALNETESSRKKLGIDNNSVLLAYSGSTAGWQSFNILHDFLSGYLKDDPAFKILFLAPEEDNIKKLQETFPSQVIRRWVNHSEVPSVLSACDLGILIREQTVTNKVASPTKFAEYLSAGLPVLISENLGDYSEFVKVHDCGFVVNGHDYPKLERTDAATRLKITGLVQKYCTKPAYLNEYRKMIDAITK